MKVDTVESSVFKKLVGNDNKVISTSDDFIIALTATSFVACCLSCKNTAGCGLVNYNMLSVYNNCELISSGQSYISVETSQPGWKVFSLNAGKNLC